MLNRASLMSLEEYAKRRSSFRTEVMEHKKTRKVHLGEHVTLLFENALTVQYQVQEMLRVERIFEEEAIHEELHAYLPLVPDGSNWKATLLIEYPNEDERKIALSKLIDLEDRVWVQVPGFDKVFPFADEDLNRENAEKTSAVHFLRFELSSDMKKSLLHGSSLRIGIDHPNYKVDIEEVPESFRDSLVSDLVADS
ncbi:MAG: DUF3501 family protein [Proteobacteria bacterium]|nr:DUF3501 family protein [Pseudomonadota bacterium]MDA1331614.1 DUF3501 family protein [Pseudomonadota bacterium]